MLIFCLVCVEQHKIEGLYCEEALYFLLCMYSYYICEISLYRIVFFEDRHTLNNAVTSVN